MIANALPVSESEKCDALDLALKSNLFARSPQLRSLLKYICEMEMSGRAEELTEYQIAVEILGRPKDVSLSEDSSVRNRAYELRQRLERFYTSEVPEADIRIDIPRGGYVPVYLRQTPPPQASASKPWLSRNRARGGILAVAAVACLAIAWLGGYRAAQPHLPQTLREAWGPLADPNSDMLIAIATNLHMLVRPHISPRPHRIPAPNDLYELFRLTRPLGTGTRLDMEPAPWSIPLGELTAAATLARTRSAFGGTYEILPESDAPVPAIWGRDTVLMGTPINSNAVTFILSQQPLSVADRVDGAFVITDQRKPAGHNEIFVAQMNGDVAPSTYYALLTVISHPDSSGRTRRLAVVTGTGAAACIQAAVEYFCSEQRMAALKRRFIAAGLAGFPPNYQVLIRCQTQGVRLTTFEYVMHVIPQRPPTLTP